MAFHHHPLSPRTNLIGASTADPNSSPKKDVSQHGCRGNINTRFEIPFDVRALSPNVEHHFGGVAIHCGNVPDGDVVHHGHNSYTLGNANHDDVANRRHLACASGSAPALVYGWCGPTWLTPFSLREQGSPGSDKPLYFGHHADLRRAMPIWKSCFCRFALGGVVVCYSWGCVPPRVTVCNG